MIRVLRLTLAGLVPLSFAAAALAVAAPRALAGVEGGLWEVSRSATGAGAQRLCVSDPSRLAEFEHRGTQCASVLISDSGGSAVFHYTCAAGGFGQSRMKAITPRTLRIETQGISGGLPFDYVLHARRLGPCTGR